MKQNPLIIDKMENKKEMYEKLSDAILKAKQASGKTSPEDRALITEVLAERKAGAKVSAKTTAPRTKKAELTPEELLAVEKEKLAKLKAKEEAKAAKEAAKAEAKANKPQKEQWILKGAKVTFIPFGKAVEEKVEGTLIGKVLDKRVNVILLRIETPDGKTVHKTIGAVELLDLNEEQAAAFAELKAYQESIKGEPAQKKSAAEKRAELEARIAELEAQLAQSGEAENLMD